MGSYRSLGVSFYNSSLQLAEVEHGKKQNITALGEFSTSLAFERIGSSLTPKSPETATLADDLKSAIKEAKADPEMISFALPAPIVFATILPMDAGLGKVDLQGYLQWELSQYFPDAGPKEFVVDSHALPTKTVGVKDSFAAGVHRGTAGFVQEVAADLGLTLHLVDIDQFAAEKTLATNYPQILEHDIVLFGLRGNAIDASVIHEGQMTDYRAYHNSDAKEAIRKYLKYLHDRYASTPAGLLLHGIGVNQELVGTLRDETGIKQTVALNALRQISATDKVAKAYGKDNAKFCAAIGLALRAK
ncbi:MAG: hypothetical protein HY966_06690 [Ignavibacteriales bacterium]|nr:hypothetical protein [Ignavibacteriales bacterium]